jgi:hypothetical protein
MKTTFLFPFGGNEASEDGLLIIPAQMIATAIIAIARC